MDKERKRQWNLRHFKQWLMDKKLEKWFRRDNLIILVLSGVLLFIIAMPMDSRKTDKGAGTGDSMQGGLELFETSSENRSDQENAQEFALGMTDKEYTVWLEQRLTDALSQVAEVGEVQVMITLCSSRELVIEREQPMTRSATNEADSQGGSRVVNQVETGDSVVYRSEGNVSEPYVIKTLPPEIEGVLVVAEGAGSGTVNRTITAVVQALFGVEAHKVSVVRMETK